MFKKILIFFQDQIWKIPLENKSGGFVFLIRQLRILMVAVRGFMDNRVSLRASALTFYTLLSVVPIAAMAFGVAKGFGFENIMEEFIINNFKGQEEVLNWIIELSYTVLEDVEGGLLAGIGLVVLIWSVMQVLTNIEDSFNAIWQVKKSRMFIRKLSDYLAIMLIAPVLIILSSSLSVYISTSIESVAQNVEIIRKFGSFVQSSLKILPYALVWILFTLVYIIMPNTRVNLKHAIIAGIIAGTVFQIVQWAYIRFQVGVSRYSALYGTFAALPLFLAWLQISWLIVLLGAQIAFAYQNVEKYEFEVQSKNISPFNKRLLLLYIAHYVVKQFKEGLNPPTIKIISQDLHISLRMVRDTVITLVETGILNEVNIRNSKDSAYQPSVDISLIDMDFVLNKYDSFGEIPVIDEKNPDYQRLMNLYEKLLNNLKTSESNLLLKDIN